jgi:membrane-associated phospholipid phosphatase
MLANASSRHTGGGRRLAVARATGPDAVPSPEASPGGMAMLVLAALAATYVLALWIQAAVYLPKEVVLLLFLGAAASCRELRPFLRDWAGPLLLLFAMDALRELAYHVTRALDRPVVVLWPVRIETAIFGVLPTQVLQGWLHPTPEPRWYDLGMAALHGSHFVTFLAVGLAVWVWRRDRFHRYMRTVLFTAYGGLAGYFLVPMAPPWLAADLGQLPPTPRLLLSVPYLQVPRFLLIGLDTNPVAAMPSLHAAFSLIVAVGLGWVSRWGRRLGYLYLLALAFALVYGGEHYTIDLLAGYGLAGFALWLAERTGGRATDPHVAPRQR